MASRKRILAIASGGGHWVQLFRLRPAFDGHDVIYATTMKGLEQQVVLDAAERHVTRPTFILLPEANRWQKVRMAILMAKIAWLILRFKPHHIISTGAAHGYFAIRFGKLIGSKTIWLDSIANAEEASMSGRLIKPYADHCLTQWPEVADKEGLAFHGAVL
jgi:UDP-N-acetylglucosamine:LPS N-acetylglucosamine transferase